MTTEQMIMAEFESLLQEGKDEAEKKVSDCINKAALNKLESISKKIRPFSYTITDITPEGYGI